MIQTTTMLLAAISAVVQSATGSDSAALSAASGPAGSSNGPDTTGPTPRPSLLEITAPPDTSPLNGSPGIGPMSPAGAWVPPADGALELTCTALKPVRIRISSATQTHWRLSGRVASVRKKRPGWKSTIPIWLHRPRGRELGSRP